MIKATEELTIKQIENFIGSFNRPDNSDLCWRWRKGFNKFGYGIVSRKAERNL